MRHPIDPKVDCVFKALLGAETNRRLLIHFLNAVLGGELPEPITDVDLLNPYNEREFLDDKLSVVDVKARDDAGRLYQIEIQLLVVPDLPARIVYGWADLYSAQLQSGQDYGALRPCYSIWLLGGTLRAGIAGYRHRFRLRDDEGCGLLDHGGIWLLELGKFATSHRDGAPVDAELTRWLRFFTEGERLDPQALPDWMQTEEMQQAMSTLNTFSEKDREYHAYQARMNYLRQQRSIQRHMEELTAQAERLRVEEEQARLAAQQARASEQQARASEQQARASEQDARASEQQARVLAQQECLAAEQARLVAEQARAGEEQAERERDLARQHAEDAQAEIERLRRLLAKDPRVG